jgi:hypothetical protein
VHTYRNSKRSEFQTTQHLNKVINQHLAREYIVKINNTLLNAFAKIIISDINIFRTTAKNTHFYYCDSPLIINCH